jgi:Na+-translocating ferredoxin:NAD+ oxidoreductase RnfC subunit
MADPKDPEQRSALAATKAERSRDKEEAMREYEAGKRAQLVNTARLRELRLAKEAADALTAKTQPPAKKKVATTASAAKAAGLKPATPKKKATRAAKSAAPRASARSAADDSPPPDTDQ